jgi:hypothetical protein
MRFVNNHIEIDRELSELDNFTLAFVNLLRKHTKYAIVSGYVSILLGRSRASEDVDIIVPKMDAAAFSKLFKDLNDNKFYCLSSESAAGAYEYLKDNIAVRFAIEGTAIPNMEFKFAKNKIDNISLAKTVTVDIGDEELVISHLELQIAFKEEVLKSQKDIEDAKHLRDVAQGHLDNGLIALYKEMLHGVY